MIDKCIKYKVSKVIEVKIWEYIFGRYNFYLMNSYK
jgi:hypothetical protein